MRKKDKDLTVISITHDIEEAFKSDRVMILNEGEIVKDGKPIDVFEDEDFIYKMRLEMPYVLKVKNDLAKKGIHIPKEIITIEELAEYLCQ